MSKQSSGSLKSNVHTDTHTRTHHQQETCVYILYTYTNGRKKVYMVYMSKRYNDGKGLSLDLNTSGGVGVPK